MPTRTSPSSAAPGRSRRRRPIALVALRGFEAAARHLSFTLAAQELNLTQSSVSRQIAALERQVGKPLFMRRTRALELTPAGEQLVRSVRQALSGIDRVIDEIRGVSGPPRVALTTFASFASLWLVPRLATFQRLYPEIELRIDAGDRQVDLEREEVDLAVRWCRPQNAPSAHATLLLEEEVTPIVSADLLTRTGVTLNSPSDLLTLPRLAMDDGHAPSMASSWGKWLEFAGTREGADTIASKVYFTHIDQSVQAAVRGQGVVMGRTPYMDELLASGKVIAPFPQLRMRTGFAYFLIEHRERRKLPHVAAFRNWLIEEFARGPRRDT